MSCLCFGKKDPNPSITGNTQIPKATVPFTMTVGVPPTASPPVKHSKGGWTNKPQSCFAKGGIVQGKKNQKKVITAHAGEMVIPVRLVPKIKALIKEKGIKVPKCFGISQKKKPATKTVTKAKKKKKKAC